MHRLLFVSVFACLFQLTGGAWAAPTDPADVERAQRHFERAQEAYKRGAYRDAVSELERAIRYDPSGKDLEYNLGMVFEKLGEIDSAIKHFRRYREMETDPTELERVDRMLERLEGAKGDLTRDPDAADPPGAADRVVPAPGEPKDRGAVPHGRLDGLTIAAGSAAVVAAAVGVVFGVRALSEAPSASERTGPSRSVGELQARADRAHSHAVVADVALLVSALSAGATAWLYFGRPQTPGGAQASAAIGRGRVSLTAGVTF
ncbi:MAG: tetratricopeptide repeat protein [Polyangiaceae bacterium]|nr:tetratricopeptide repeat protein [Polyangiaceae bacterium]